MKKCTLLIICLLQFLIVYSQTNIDSVGNLPYARFVNDIWGYVAPDNTEYALVGTSDGVSIVSLATPESPVEVAFVEGSSSIWRDIKTWGQHAYVTTEAADGLQVIDLSNLPNTVSHYFWKPTLEDPSDSLSSCHNLYIDENGYCYLSGCNLNFGGLIIADVFTNPGAPQVVGVGPDVYSHDIYVKDNIAYSSDMEFGVLSIHDVSDKSNIVLLSTLESPFQFTHNAWLSDDGKTVFTTDELPNAPTAAFDISDLQDIKPLATFVPAATRGQGVIPHNVHYINGFLAISHYGDGLIIVDANRPGNLVEVGNYDTSLGVAGLTGAWGAYPFLPSGLVLVSDSETGLWVFRPTYKRAAYLEGTITDGSTGQGLVGAIVSIEETGANGLSDLTGAIKMGSSEPGSYQVTISKRKYISQTVTVDLTSGEVSPLNITLEKTPTFTLSGITVGENGEAIGGTSVVLFDGEVKERFSANEAGEFVFDQALVNTNYSLFFGKWGYLTDTISIPAVTIEGDVAVNPDITVTLQEGIADPFALDLGWTVIEDVMFGGGFELGTPVLADDTPFLNEDVPTDIGTGCYSTGNSAEVPDNVFLIGTTALTSPVFDMSTMMNPTVSYSTLYGNLIFVFDGLETGVETMRVYLNNGTERVLVEEISNDFNTETSTLPTWKASTITVKDFITPTATMTISFELSSDDPNSIFEVGVDDFKAFDSGTVSVEDFIKEELTFTAAPNPFEQELFIQYNENEWTETPSIVLFDVLGKVVLQQVISSNTSLMMPNQLPTGTYFLQLRSLEKGSKVIKVVK